METAEKAVTFAVDNEIPVMFVTEDTTRSKPEEIKQVYEAIELGADRICVCDTCGHVTPNGVRKLLEFIQEEVIPDSGVKRREIEVNWHGHQDRGLGVANNLAAYEAGADVIHGTALGVGREQVTHLGPNTCEFEPDGSNQEPSHRAERIYKNGSPVCGSGSSA